MGRHSLPPLEGDFTRALLRSAESDEPSSAAYAKVASALGVGVGLGISASLPAPAAVVAGAAGLASAARWSGSLAVRLAALGVSGVLVVGAAAFLLPDRVSGRVASGGAAGSAMAAKARALPVPRAVALTPSAPPSATAPFAAPPAPVVAVEPPSSRTLTMGKPSRPIAKTAAGQRPARSSHGSSLAEQVQSLDRARVALGSGDASAALREIAHYRKAWPDGVFLTEASVLEIEALAARGERSLAASRASAFVAAHPDSPQAGRLRALLPRSP